jgi:hypothetical protein
MIIHFGFDFDGPVSAADGVSGTGCHGWDRRGLLRWLEAQLGLGGYPPERRLHYVLNSIARH